MTKTISEVLAEHVVITDGLYEPSGWCATCGNLDHGDQEEHQSAALSAAGFGLVADAGAKALEDAAEHIMGPSDYLADRATCHNTANDLRARAAAVRGES